MIEHDEVSEELSYDKCVNYIENNEIVECVYVCMRE